MSASEIILQVLHAATPATPAIATLLAAFFGAWFAYRLQDKVKVRDERAYNISVANRALFTLFQQINILEPIQWQVIDPVRNHPMKFIAMQPVLPLQHEDFQFDFASLGFLLNSSHKQIMLDLFIEQRRFFEAIKAINYRSELHHDQVQPKMERAEIQEGVDYPAEALAAKLTEALGPRLIKSLQRATDEVIYNVDRTVDSLDEIKGKMIMTFKELYPEGDFLNYEVLEDPPNIDLQVG
jgi:hypothetical protein